MVKSTFHRPPAGARDLLPLDVEQKQWVEARLQQVFERWGYRQIVTPTLERLDSLTAGGAIEPAAVLQVRDVEGTMLGLRPEVTASIVRAAATRMARTAFPIRLFYNDSPVFRNAQRDKEFFQAGVELIGAPGWLADAEVTLVVADCMRTLNVPDWTLVVGNVGLTQGLLSSISPSAQPRIRKAIATLDRVYLETADISESDRAQALQVFDLRGAPETVFDQLDRLSLPDGLQKRAKDLRQLCDVLTAQGVPLVVDLSLLHTTISYYTDLVFEAIAGNERVGLGGRYNTLFSLYSPTQEQKAGIGFSLTIEALQQVLKPTEQLPENYPEADCLLVPTESAAVPSVLQLAQTLRAQPPAKRVEIELLADVTNSERTRSADEIAAYARECGIPEIVWVQADGSHTSTSPQMPVDDIQLGDSPRSETAFAIETPSARTVTVALAKGELLKGAVSLFKNVGIDFSQLLDKSNRLLRITSPTSPDGNIYEALLVRTHDVPVYVEYGQAQLGVVGYDVLREKQAHMAHLVDLNFGGCRMSVAVPESSPYRSALDLPPNACIASKFVNCAAEYFEQLDLPVDIVPLYGSVELAPLTGMADAIVDLVATGRTLKENGLIELDCIYDSTARLVAHPIAYRIDSVGLADLVEHIREAMASSPYATLR